MDKKKKLIEKHNEFVDEVIEELILFGKRYWNLFKQPKFFIFYQWLPSQFVITLASGVIFN